MTDRHLGINAWAFREQFPWMTMPAVTNAWIADAKYMDSLGSVGVWKPQKGTIQLVQGTGANKPTFSAAWGSKNKGMLTFDGVNDLMTGDALAPFFSTTQPMTTIASYQSLATPPGAAATVWGYGAAAAAASLYMLQQDPTSPYRWREIYYDDAGDARFTQGTDAGTVPTTNRTVVTTIFDGVTYPTFRISGGAQNYTVASVPGVAPGATNFTKFTVGAMRWSTTGQWFTGNLRGLIVQKGVMPSAHISACENAFLAEAA